MYLRVIFFLQPCFKLASAVKSPCLTVGICLMVFHNREEIEKQKSKERYNKLHSEGKTEQARADLARLAIIKKQREDAAKKREELRKGEEATPKVSSRPARLNQ